ncbi:MAG: hypothetical protein EBS05_17570, partial [Proteobacteria bacterium]|nr:hypothetical protein [Pseudomonadota bacterium]
SAEVYDPAQGTWTSTSPLATGRYLHTATLLPNGKVLVTGGENGSSYMATTEVYDPTQGIWTATGPLLIGRSRHTATLLANGKVLVTGGFTTTNNLYDLGSVEVYDLALGAWTANSPLATKRKNHTATLLPNGKVLVMGGDGPIYLASAEVYDVRLDYSPAWQPQLAAFSSPLVSGGSLGLSGTRFRGVSGASGGYSQDSSSDNPVVQLRNVESGQTVYAHATNWSATAYQSAPVSGLPAGWTMLTVIVNGIPSESRMLAFGAAPSVLSQPQNQLVALGANAIFSVAADGTAPMSYQWRSNGVTMAGETNVALVLTNVQFTTATDYDVLITNEFGSITSSVAALYIPTLQLAHQGTGTLTANPQQGTYNGGQTVALTATPGRYYAFSRWSDGVTTSNRTITIGATNIFTAVFTNTVPLETQTSGGVSREVPAGTPAILVDNVYSTNHFFAAPRTVTVAMTSSYPGAVIFVSTNGGNPADGFQYSGPFTVSATTLVRAAALDSNFNSVGEADPVQVSILPVYVLTDSTPGGGTVAALPAGGSYLAGTIVTNTATASNGWSFVRWEITAGGVTTTNTSQPLALILVGNTSLKAVFATPVSASVVGGPGDTVSLTPATGPYPYGSTVRFTAVPGAGRYFRFWGGAASGQVVSPLEFVVTNASPTNSALFAALAGTDRALNVIVNGSGTVTKSPSADKYADGTVVNLIAAPAAGQYFQGWAGDATGGQNPLPVTLNASKTITAQFGATVVSSASINNVTVTERDAGTTNAVFTVSLASANPQVVTIDFTTTNGTAQAGSDYVTNSGRLTFNPGETSKTITAVVNGDTLIEGDETFGVLLYNPVNATLQTALGIGTILNDDVAPFITAQPQSLTNIAGTNVNLSVTAAGSGTLAYQWRRGGSPLAGETGATLALGPATTNLVGGYDVVVTNGSGAITSAVATLTVHMPPFISQQPANLTVLPGGTAVFTVLGGGIPAPAYQWHKGGVTLPGETGSTLTIPNVQLSSAGNYSVTLTNLMIGNVIGAITSSPAVLTANPPPSVTLTSPANGQSFGIGTNITLSASASDPDGTVASVEFFANGVSVGTDTTTPHGLTWSPSAGLYTLTARVLDNLGAAATSAPVMVRVQSLPPTVNLLTPTNGQVFTLPTNILVQAQAIDTDGFTNLVSKVEFFAGTNLLATVNGPTNTTPEFTWTNPPPGQHRLKARATDVVGYVAESAENLVTVTYPAGAVPLFSFAQDTYTVRENDGSVTLTVLKHPSPAGSVGFTTRDGSARATSGGNLGDYQTTVGTLNFLIGEVQKTITIPIVNDEGYETNQSFTVELSVPQGVTGALTNPSVATVIILDDDPAPTTNSVTTVLNPSALPDAAQLGALQVGAVCTNLPGIASTNVGQWRLRWDTVWHNSGTVLGKLQPGSYEIVFQSREGFTTPAPQTVAVGAGAALAATGYYQATTALQLGHLTVQLTPAVDSVRWRLQGETTWRLGSDTASATISNLVAGSYVVEFDTLAGAGYLRLPPANVRVYPNFAGTVRYAFPNNNATWGMTEVSSNRLVTVQAGEPHAFNGQLLGEGGYGTGTVVKRRVVLTAAHLVFDDRKLAFVTNVYWFHRRYAGFYEPRPQQPRGWYVFGGYDSQRGVERTPGVSAVPSQKLDTAALFFFEDAGAGGQSGYLASDAGTNWLTVTADKLLTGYPLDFPAPLAGQRKLQQTALFNPGPSDPIYSPDGPAHRTDAFRSSGGNSGGAVCVKFNNTFYPAGVFLGGNNQSNIRLIDRDVVELIIRAELTANTGDNNTSGGVPGGSGEGQTVPLSAGQGAMAVRFPADALAAGAGWRYVRPGGGTDPFITDNTLTTNRLVGLSVNEIEFNPLPGFLTPGRFTVPVVTNATQMVNVVFARNLTNRIINRAPDDFQFEIGASSFGRVEVFGIETNKFRGSGNYPWVSLGVYTLNTNGVLIFTNFQGTPFQFFRTVYLPNP